MWNPGGSLMLCRFFLIASALGPVCGMVGMLGDAPVVLNAPSLSRLVIGAWANAAVVVSSAAVDSATMNCLRMTKPPDSAELLVRSAGGISFAHRHAGSSGRCAARRDTAHVGSLGPCPIAR